MRLKAFEITQDIMEIHFPLKANLSWLLLRCLMSLIPDEETCNNLLCMGLSSLVQLSGAKNSYLPR